MKKLYYIMTLVFGGLLALSFVGSTNVSAAMLQVTFATNPTVVAPGTVGYIEVDLKDTGNVISYTDITATSSSPTVIIPQGNWDVEVGSLDTGASTSVIYQFRVPATASPGLYQVVFDITGAGGSIQQTAIVKVQDTTVLDITSMSPTSITIGEATTMKFNITNNGNADLNNVLFSWEDPNNLILPVGTDNKILIPFIGAMNHTTLSVVMMASSGISPGIYPLTMTMTYYDMTGTEQNVVSTVGLQISGTTSFDLVVQTSSGSTTFSVVNTGANTASSVIVSIPQQPNYQVTGASSASLGNLNAGDYTLATFQIAARASNSTSQFPGFNRTRTNGSQFRNFTGRSSFSNQSIFGFGGGSLLVQISYTDVFGVRQTVQKQVSMSSGSSSFGSSRSSSSSGSSSSSNSFRTFGQTQSTGGSNNSLWYIGIGVAGIIIIIAIIQLSRKKKLSRLSAYFKGRKE